MLLWLPFLMAMWFGIGLLVAVPFLIVGVGRAVEGAAGSSVAFRLLVLPGAVALWPVILHRWVTTRRAGNEHA